MKASQKHSVFLGLKLVAAAAAALALAGCLPSTGTPERLYPVASEMAVVRTTQEELVRLYNRNVFSAPSQARLIRNEIIAQRMYAIDVQYTQYENALTREGQEINFGTLTAAGTLGTASQLFTPTVTKSVLSGLSTVTLAANGHYNTDILMAQSIRTIQKQMRASRNLIAADISAKMIKGVSDYPLLTALSDVEDYYNAGTLTTGVIDASTTVGARETATKELKQDVTLAAPAARADIIREAAMHGTGGASGGVVVVGGNSSRPAGSGQNAGSGQKKQSSSKQEAAVVPTEPGGGTSTTAKTCAAAGPSDAGATGLIEFLCPAPAGVLSVPRKNQLVTLNPQFLGALMADPDLIKIPAKQKQLIVRAKAMASSPEVIVFSKNSLDLELREKFLDVLKAEMDAKRLVPSAN